MGPGAGRENALGGGEVEEEEEEKEEDLSSQEDNFRLTFFSIQ